MAALVSIDLVLISSPNLNYLPAPSLLALRLLKAICAMPSPSPERPNEATALSSVHTSNLPELFDQLGISLIVSTYQAGKAIVVRNDNGTLNTHFRTFTKPMGIVADHNRLTIGGANTVWEYRNMPEVAKKLKPAGKHDACYLPRRIHVTGDID